MTSDSYADPKQKELIKSKIIFLLERGLDRLDSCSLLKISYKSLEAWITESEDFARDIKRAEQDLQQRMLALIEKASKRKWTAAAWILERKWSDKYALTTKQKLEGYIESSESDADRAERKKNVVAFLSQLRPRNMKADIKPTETRQDDCSGTKANSPPKV